MISTSNAQTGPFELTKLSAQISTLMAKSNTSSMDDPVRLSYQRKGTFKTAKNIIAHRGFPGLYSGFKLHIRKPSPLYTYIITSLRDASSERYNWHDHLLYDLRKHETADRQVPGQRLPYFSSLRRGCWRLLRLGVLGLRKFHIQN
jgi:hypothetical protein